MIHPPSIPHVAAQVGCWFTLAEWLAGWPVLLEQKPNGNVNLICKDFARIASFPPRKAFCCLPVLMNVLGCLREVLSFWLCLTTHNNHHSSFHIPFPSCYATDITVACVAHSSSSAIRRWPQLTTHC